DCEDGRWGRGAGGARWVSGAGGAGASDGGDVSSGAVGGSAGASAVCGDGEGPGGEAIAFRAFLIEAEPAQREGSFPQRLKPDSFHSVTAQLKLCLSKLHFRDPLAWFC